MELIRIKDIAEKAGVSPTTVSNVIHGNTKKVSKATIERIQKLLQDVSYVPSMSARMLAEKRSRIIGVLLGGNQEQQKSGQGNAFANLIIRALEYEIYAHNYYMMLHMSSTTEENLQLAATWNVEGLITVGLSVENNKKIQSRCGAPMVSIDNYYEDSNAPNQIANVGLDDWQGGYEMGKFLISMGHRNMLFLSDNDVGVDHYRFLGFQSALLEAGVKQQEDQPLHVVMPENAVKRMAYYDKNRSFLMQQDALFFASDYYALEAINDFRDKGIRIPQDVSVAGFDDSEYALLARPHLTTIRQDVREKGIAAVKKLFAFIEGEKTPNMRESLPIKLVIRKSVIKRA